MNFSPLKVSHYTVCSLPDSIYALPSVYRSLSEHLVSTIVYHKNIVQYRSEHVKT